MVTQRDSRRQESRAGLAIPVLAVVLAMKLNSAGGQYSQTAVCLARDRTGARVSPAHGDHRLRPPGSIAGPPEVHARYMCATRRSFVCPAKRGEIGGISLDPMANPEPKGHLGDNSMPGNQRSCPGVRGDALGDLHDTAKAKLPEA